MNKRAILSLSIALTTPMMVSAEISDTQKEKNTNHESRPKNVIFIFTDDMRLDMNSYAGGYAATPNIDALRAESVDFSQACTTTGLSSPSRAALFTGRLGHRTGLNDNLHLWHCQDITLSKDESTILEWAALANYNTGYFGKWHVGHITPDERGATEYVGNKIESSVNKATRPSFESVKAYYKDYTPTKGRVAAKPYKQGEEKPHYYSTLNITYQESEPKRQVDLGIDFLSRVDNSDKPFFLTVSLHHPHPPYRVPEPWSSMYDYRDVKLPKSMELKCDGLQFQHDVLWPWMDVGHMSEDDWRKTISYSMGMVTMLDKALGELFDAIKKSGKWDDTLIVFTSDQGSMLAEHGLYDKGPYAYEGLMRIPMLIKAPGIEAKVIKHQVSLIDLNQTLVEYMGLQPTQANIDSRSLWPLINKGDRAWSDVPDEAFYRYEVYNGRWFGHRAIRTPEYKYCFNPNGSDELYNIKDDPEEITNLIESKYHKEILERLRIRLLDHLLQIDDDHGYEIMSAYTNIDIKE